MKATSIVVFSASALLFVGAVFAVRGELALAYAGAGSDRTFFDRAVSAPFPSPGSISGTGVILRRCSDVVGGLYGAVQPPHISATARHHCLEFADAALAAMPTHALGHYVAAKMHLYSGNDVEGASALVLSQRYGPQEQWLAEARVELVETFFERLSEAALARHTADLGLLARSGRGVRSIAQRYVSDPAFRERITEIVETLPAQEQTRFLANVRRAAEAYGFRVEQP